MLTTAPRGKIEMVQGILKKKKKERGRERNWISRIDPEKELQCYVMLCFIYITHLHEYIGEVTALETTWKHNYILDQIKNIIKNNLYNTQTSDNP